MPSRSFGPRCVAALLAATLSLAGGARAQDAGPGSLPARYDAAFQETLRDPANLDALFRFASLAVESGDLEGAVSALERMLILNPDQPRVRIELGVLYFRLGSYPAARSYLETALASTRSEEHTSELQ